jgi:hypothetical protein
VAGLATENLELRSRLAKLEMDHSETKKKLLEVEKILREMVEE